MPKKSKAASGAGSKSAKKAASGSWSEFQAALDAKFVALVRAAHDGDDRATIVEGGAHKKAWSEIAYKMDGEIAYAVAELDSRGLHRLAADAPDGIDLSGFSDKDSDGEYGPDDHLEGNIRTHFEERYTGFGDRVGEIGLEATFMEHGLSF